MLTTFLTRADVARHARALHLLPDVRAAFAKAAQAEGAELPLDAAGELVRRARLPGVPASSVLTQRGARAVLQLHDEPTGALLAVMDAGVLGPLAVALTAALSVDLLARADAAEVAVVGASPAVSGLLKALRLVRSVRQVRLWSPEPAPSTELALRLHQTMSMSVQVVDTPEDAVAVADLVLLMPGARLEAPLRPGTHLTVLGAPSEAPLAASIWDAAQRFVDHGAGTPAWCRPDASLGQLLADPRLGRRDPDAVTGCVVSNPPFLDLVAGWHVLEGARQDDGLTRIDLEA